MKLLCNAVIEIVTIRPDSLIAQNIYLYCLKEAVVHWHFAFGSLFCYLKLQTDDWWAIVHLLEYPQSLSPVWSDRDSRASATSTERIVNFRTPSNKRSALVSSLPATHMQFHLDSPIWHSLPPCAIGWHLEAQGDLEIYINYRDEVLLRCPLIYRTRDILPAHGIYRDQG